VSRGTRQRRAMTGVRSASGPARGLAGALASLAAAALLAGCAGPAAGGPAAGQTAASNRTAGQASTTATTDRFASGGATAACNPYASLAPQSGGPSVTAGSWAATIRARGYLIAGVDQTTYHFGYLNPLTGQIEGFDIDMVKDVAAAIFGLTPDSPALAQHIHFKSIDDAHRIPDAQNGTVDIVAHTMTVNCARMQDVDFSSVYYDAKQRVLVDAAAGGATGPDLAQLGAARQKVCATKDSDSVAQIQAAHAVPVQVTYWSDCLVLLEEGQVAGISTDDSILYGMQAQDPGTVLTGPALEDEPYGLAISKAHPDFVRFVNAVLAADRANGQWAKSYRAWVSATAPLPTWPIDYAG
jgi:polar amino acid transport system substrate-binding protein